MKQSDKTIIATALNELHGVTGPAYIKATNEYTRAMFARDDANNDLQKRFAPSRNQIIAIIRRELRARGLSCERQYAPSDSPHVYFKPNDTHAVGVNHIEYTIHANLDVEVWVGHGLTVKWSGPYDTAEHFERSFSVFLATMDGYMAGVKAAGGKDCKTCGLLERWKFTCDRCKKCKEGSLWL